MTDDMPASPQGTKSGARTGGATGLESFTAQGSERQGSLEGGLASALNPAEILGVLSRWKLAILAAALLGALLALAASMAMTPLYVASTQIQINQEDSVTIKGANGARPVMISNTEFLATQLGLLRSRDLAERVVDANRLANNPAYATQAGTAKERRDQATNTLIGQMAIEEVRSSRLVNIIVTSPNPAMSAQLANAFAEQFIASNLDRDYQATAYQRKFLEDRIASTRAKLEDSERELVGYAANQGIIELGSDEKGGNRQSLEVTTLIALNSALAQARTDRIAAEQRMTNARSGMATTEANNSPVLQELFRRRAEVQAEYDSKLTVFLPDLPAMAALRERITSIDQNIARERGRVNSGATLDYRAAVARERELQNRVNALKVQVLDLRSRSIQYTILQRDVDTNRALYDALLQNYKEVGVTGGVGSNKVSIVDRARQPNYNVSPRVAFNTIFGLLAGLFLGLVGVFLYEFLDDKIKSPDDVKSKLRMTLLGVMPAIPEKENFLEVIGDPKGDLSEAAHSLRTTLQFATGHGMPRTVLTSSSGPGEGKSCVALSLGVSLARIGKKVLIIDADIRKPSFYVGNSSRSDTPGLSNILSGEGKLSSVVRKSEIANVSIVPAGPSVPNPVALLSEGGFEALLEEAKQHYDYIIVDGPPVIGLADSPLMGSMVEGVLLVVEASSAHRSMILTSAARLLASNTRLLGVVLNKFESRRNGYGYGYAYSYDYGDEASRDSEEHERRIVVIK